MARSASGPWGTNPSSWWLFWFIVGIFVLQVLYGVVVFQLFGQPNEWMAERGQFGDIFGGANAFFTGAALAGIIFTILLQRGDLEVQRTNLELTREELRLTREELERAAQAQVGQLAALKDSANLSARTALMNAYGTLLAPYRSRRMELWLDLQRCLAQLKDIREALNREARMGKQIWDPEIAKLERRENAIMARRNDLREQINKLDETWEDARTQQNALVTKLTEKVEQAEQSSPT
jgi:hypothetical protein